MTSKQTGYGAEFAPIEAAMGVCQIFSKVRVIYPNPGIDVFLQRYQVTFYKQKTIKSNKSSCGTENATIEAAMRVWAKILWNVWVKTGAPEVHTLVPRGRSKRKQRKRCPSQLSTLRRQDEQIASPSVSRARTNLLS